MATLRFTTGPQFTSSVGDSHTYKTKDNTSQSTASTQPGPAHTSGTHARAFPTDPFNLRVRQASIALEIVHATLPPDGLPYKVAAIIARQFATAEPFEENGRTYDRLEVATERMYTQLRDRHLECTAEIEQGIALIRRALCEARAEIRGELAA